MDDERVLKGLEQKLR